MASERAHWQWWIALAAYQTIAVLGHLQFSIWLVKGRPFEWGGQVYSFAFSMLVPWVGALAALVLACWLLGQARRAARPLPVLHFWLAWSASVWLVDRHLTYSLNETAHYPQYGLLAWLMARALDPPRTEWPVARVLLWVTLLGAIDEWAQYLWITRSYSNYLDFNDILVNLMGASAGVMVYYGFRTRPVGAIRVLPRPDGVVIAALIVVFAVALRFEVLRLDPGETRGANAPAFMLPLQREAGFYGSRQLGKRHGTYLVLAPGPALGMMAMYFLLLSCFPGRPARAPANGSRSPPSPDDRSDAVA